MKIRPRTLPSGLILWVADFGMVSGTRVQRSFPTKTEAENAIWQAKQEGLSLAVVPAEEIRAALKFYREQQKTVVPSPPYPEMIEAYMLELTRLRRNRLYQAQTEAHLKALGARVGDRIDMWTAASLQAWICVPGLAPATQRNRNATVRAFLEWAKRMQYIQRSPIEGIHRLRFANHTGKEVESFSVSEIRSLLRGLLFEHYDAFSPKKGFYKKPFHELIGYVVLAVFCGVRPEEIRKVTLGRLDLVGRTLLITKEASKTASTRVIELPRVAVVWLRLWRWKCHHQNVLVPKNFQKKWDSLRAATLNGRWVHDGLRHTFASMHYAVHRNAAELKALMGHSQNENTLFAHYRAVQTLGGEVVTKKMGQEFWAMTPKRVRGIQ